MSYVLLLLAVGVTIYAFVDCWNSSDAEVRGFPRPAWLVVTVLFPLVGGAAYLVFGRGRHDPLHLHRPRVIAPDDDPEFLRRLDTEQRRAAAEERRREQHERKERDRKERQERKEQHQGDHDGEGGTQRPL